MTGAWASLAALAAAAALLLARRPGLPAGPPAVAGHPGRPSRTRRSGAVGLAAGSVVLLAGGWWAASPASPAPPTTLPVGLVLAAAATAGTGLVRRQRQRRHRAARADRVLEAGELLAAELAGGLASGTALSRAAAAEPLLAAAASAEHLGADVADALRRSAAAPGAAGLARLAAAWEISRRTGQRLAPAVAAATGSLRRDRATRRVVDAELSSARATARLLAALPVLALLLGSGTGAGPWAFLLGTAPGVVCLATGLGLGLAGLGWIERITDSAEATPAGSAG